MLRLRWPDTRTGIRTRTRTTPLYIKDIKVQPWTLTTPIPPKRRNYYSVVAGCIHDIINHQGTTRHNVKTPLARSFDPMS